MIFRESFDLLSTLSSFVAISGAMLLVRSILKTGPHEIASMSGTFLGGNPHLRNAFVEQRTDSIIGFTLTLVGSVMSAITSIVSFEVKWNFKNLVIIVAGLAAFLLIIMMIVKKIQKVTKLKVNSIAYAEYVVSYLKYPETLNQGTVNEWFESINSYNIEAFKDSNLDKYENIAKILNHADFKEAAKYVAQMKERFQPVK